MHQLTNCRGNWVWDFPRSGTPLSGKLVYELKKQVYLEFSSKIQCTLVTNGFSCFLKPIIMGSVVKPDLQLRFSVFGVLLICFKKKLRKSCVKEVKTAIQRYFVKKKTVVLKCLENFEELHVKWNKLKNGSYPWNWL